MNPIQFLLLTISVMSSLNSQVPCTFTKLLVNGEAENISTHDIAINARFISINSDEGNLYLWDLYLGNNAIINLRDTFDSVGEQIKINILDVENILISQLTTQYTDDHNGMIVRIKVIKYNCQTKELIRDFYEYQTEYQLPECILDFNIYNNTLNIVTAKGLLHQISLTTEEEIITDLFESLPDAIGYEVQFITDENIIIVANKYTDPRKPHTIRFWHNNLFITSENIPLLYVFSGLFSDGSILLRQQSSNGAKIYNIHPEINHSILMPFSDINIYFCGVITENLGAIVYEQENHYSLKLINNQTQKSILFGIPYSIEILTACIIGNKVLKTILRDKRNSNIFVLEINLFNSFNYVINREIRGPHPLEMLTGNYQILYDLDTESFAVQKASSDLQDSDKPAPPVLD